MATKDVLLQLLSIQLLGLSIVTHKPLITMRNIQTAVKSTLRKSHKLHILQADLEEQIYLCNTMLLPAVAFCTKPAHCIDSVAGACVQ